MPTEEVTAKLHHALGMLPGIEKRIVERQSEEKVMQGKQRLALLGADVASAIYMLGGGGSSNEPDTPVPSSWKVSLKPKDDAVRGKTFSDTKWMSDGDNDLVDCTFTKKALQTDTIAKNIRLFNPTFKDLDPWSPGGSNASFGFYINMGKKGEQRLGFVIYGGKVVGLNATEFMETKDFDPMIIGLDFTESPGIDDGIRIRHGAHALIYGCKGLKSVTMRGHHHAVVDCPDTVVDILSGNISPFFKEWIEEKRAGKGNYQSSAHCYAEGVKAVNIGAKTQDNTPVKAKHCMTAPGQVHKLLEQDGFEERKFKSMDELEKVQ